MTQGDVKAAIDAAFLESIKKDFANARANLVDQKPDAVRAEFSRAFDLNLTALQIAVAVANEKIKVPNP